jgi:signal peptidase I
MLTKITKITGKLKVLKLSLAFITCLALLVTLILNLGFKITYSPTTSMPKGFYIIIPVKNIYRNDIVSFIPPNPGLNFLNKHPFAPKNNTLIKYTFGIPGDYVCQKNGYLWINNKKIVKVYKYYAPHMLLPQTFFCGKLAKEQYMLLSNKAEHSFDSRYFGPVMTQNIIGKAIKL